MRQMATGLALGIAAGLFVSLLSARSSSARRNAGWTCIVTIPRTQGGMFNTIEKVRAMNQAMMRGGFRFTH